LAADLFAIIDKNSVGMVDIDPQQRMSTLRNEFDTPALIAERLDHWGQQGLQLF